MYWRGTKFKEHMVQNDNKRLEITILAQNIDCGYMLEPPRYIHLLYKTRVQWTLRYFVWTCFRDGLVSCICQPLCIDDAHVAR